MADPRQITVYLPLDDPLRAKLVAAAEKRGVSLSALVRDLLTAHYPALRRVPHNTLNRAPHRDA